jgi:conjugal transfer pilus assembly protein TraF
MKLIKFLILNIFLISCISGNAIAGSKKSNIGYYSDDDVSWHFYNEEYPEDILPEEPKKEEKKKPEEKKPEKESESKVADIKIEVEGPIDIKIEGPQPGSTKWLRENLPKILDGAIDNPTQENIRRYAYMQRLGVDKADTFSQEYEKVMATDAYLDENRRRPQAQFLKTKIGREIKQYTNKLFKEFAKDFSYFFFFDQNCTICGHTAKVLNFMETRFGATVIAISLDGKEPNFPFYKEFQPDKGQAEALNIVQIPAVFGYHVPSKKWAPVFSGYLTHDEIVMKSLLIANANDWIGDDEIMKTRFVQNNDLLNVQLNTDENKLENEDTVNDMYKTLRKEAGYKDD